MSGLGKLCVLAICGLLFSVGGSAADDEVLRLTFDRPGEVGYRLQHGAEVRTGPAVAIGGQGALWCDTTGSQAEWHEFLHSDHEAVPLAANATYRVTWDYHVVSLADDATVYFLARSAAKPIAEDRGRTSWRVAPGAYGHREAAFTLGPDDDYYLIFGLRRRGEVAIDNVVVRRVADQPTKPPAPLVMATSMAPASGIVKPGETVSVRCEAISISKAVAFGTIAPYKEEHQPNGDVWARRDRAPDGAEAVKLVFAINRDDVTDWIDWNSAWSPALDLSTAEEAVIDVFSEQADSGPVMKMMAGRQVIAEQRIAPASAEASAGKSAVGRWQTFRVPLRGERDKVTMIGFYLACRGSIGAGERVTYYLRNLRFEPEPAGWRAPPGQVRVTGHLVDFDGNVVAAARPVRGRSDITARHLPMGYYEARFEGQVGKNVHIAKASFAVMPEPSALTADEPFGINHGRRYPEQVARAGICWDRFNLGWRWVEVEPDRWRDDAYDEPIARSRGAGVNLLGLLAGPPEWRQEIVPGVERRAFDFYGRTFAPKDPAAFGEFVSRMVRRYRDQIRYWEIWNEPQVTEIFFYGGTPERYVALLKEAYRRAKDADPECVVVGMGGVNPDYLEKCLPLGAADCMDAVSIHSYMPGTPPEGGRLASDIIRTRELLERYGKPMPIWLTEIGWPTSIGECRGWRGSSEADQARYLVRSFLLSTANGVDKFFFYMLFDSGTDPAEFEHNQGLLRYDLTPKPSYVAYANLIRLTAGRRFARRLEVHPCVHALVFEGEERATIALWSLAEELTLSLEEAPEGATITGMMGRQFNAGEVIGIGDGPIYIDVPRAELARLVDLLQQASWSACAPAAAVEAGSAEVGKNAAIVHATLRGALVERSPVRISVEGGEEVQVLPRDGIAVELASGEQTDVGFLVRWPEGREPQTVGIRVTGGGLSGTLRMAVGNRS